MQASVHAREGTGDAPAVDAADTRRLRVMHVILSRGFAGSERAAAECCAAMLPRHDVALVIRRDHRGPDGASILDALPPGVEVFEVPPRWGTMAGLADVIRRWSPHIIHTHLRRGTRYVARIGPGVPHVCTLHLSINGPHFLRTDGLFCISEWQLAVVPADYAGQVFLVPNSLVPHQRLDPERVRALRAELGAGDDDYLVGGVGRLAHRKGFNLLIRAFQQANLPRARLVIAGEGRERRRLERLADERVLFTGFRRDVKAFYQAFDLFVCPSSHEPFGRVLAEALDAGVPVIATDALGPRDLAGRYPIQLVPRNDVDRLADALVRAAAAGRVRVESDLSEFSLERTAQRMESAYQSVLAARHGRAAGAGVAPPAAPTSATGESRPVRSNARGGFAPRILFAPVSGPSGSGELMRCLTIARALARAEPGADIRFLVSRNAVFREAVSFPIIDCDASPTKSTRQVLAAIDDFRPHVMVFDNSGRTHQLQAAKRAGARLVYCSRAPQVRWKAFRLKWMRLIDEHWIVYPTFVTGGLTPYVRLKLRFFPDYRTRCLDTLFTPSDPVVRQAWLDGHRIRAGEYVAFVPGGRGEARPRQTVDPAQIFIEAARGFVAATGFPAVVLTGRRDAPDGEAPNLRLLPRIGPDEVQHVLAEAALVVSNGGSTMIHSLAHGRPLVAVPIAKDQDWRIRRAAKLQIAVRAALDASVIAAAATALLGDAARQKSMAQRVAQLGIANGVTEAVTALRDLAARSSA